MMKLAVMLDQISKGGTSKLAIEEVAQLKKDGYDAELLVLYDNGLNLYADLLKDIKVRVLWNELPACARINFRIPFFSFFSFFHISYVAILPFLIKRKEYDFVITHLTYTCFCALSLSKIRRIPYVAYVHDSISYIIKKAYLNAGKAPFLFYPAYSLSGLADKLIFRNAWALCKQSSFESEYVGRAGRKKVYIVPPATYKRRDVIPDKRGDKLIAFTKWDFTKNFDFLIKILQILPAGQKLYVAGQWHPQEYLYEVRGSLEREGIDNRVIFLQNLSEAEIKKLFDEALFLIHPLVEAWGSTLYEAACNGVTFIAPKGCGISDYLIHEKDAFYPEQGNTRQYLQYIDKLLATPGLAYAMGRQAWLDIKKIDIENHAKMLIGAIKEGGS